MILLDIFSPSGTVFSGEVEAVFLPGAAGAFEVLPGHAPIISSLESGDVRYRINGKEETVSAKSGFVKHEKDHMVVCIELK